MMRRKRIRGRHATWFWACSRSHDLTMKKRPARGKLPGRQRRFGKQRFALAPFRKRRRRDFMADGRYPGYEHWRVNARHLQHVGFCRFGRYQQPAGCRANRDEPPVDVITHLAFDQNTHMSLRRANANDQIINQNCGARGQQRFGESETPKSASSSLKVRKRRHMLHTRNGSFGWMHRAVQRHS